MDGLETRTKGTSPPPPLPPSTGPCHAAKRASTHAVLGSVQFHHPTEPVKVALTSSVEGGNGGTGPGGSDRGSVPVRTAGPYVLLDSGGTALFSMQQGAPATHWYVGTGCGSL
jgi:hypothetical protein